MEKAEYSPQKMMSLRLEVFYFSRFICFLFIACAMLLALTEVAEGRQNTIFSMDVVASTCHVVVDADSTGNSGRLTFGTYRKSTGASVPPRDFTVRLYESGATVQGCSAFQAGQVATLDFGNPGQLDAGGGSPAVPVMVFAWMCGRWMRRQIIADV